MDQPPAGTQHPQRLAPTLFAAKDLRVLPTEEQLARELEARHVLDIPTEGDGE
jgi:hypothetical protein